MENTVYDRLTNHLVVNRLEKKKNRPVSCGGGNWQIIEGSLSVGQKIKIRKNTGEDQ